MSNALDKAVSRDVMSSITSKTLYLATRFFLPPIVLAYISLEEYGIWAVCFILIGYLGISAFGVSNVYVRYVAEYYSNGRIDKINRLLSTGMISVSVLSCLILTVLWIALPTLVDLFAVSAAHRDTAIHLIFWASAVFMLDLSVGAFAYVLHGMQRIADHNRIWVVSFCLEAVLIVALLYAGLGLYALLAAFALRYVFAALVSARLCFRVLPELQLGLRHFDRSYLQLFYRYGSVVQLAGFLAIFLRSIEKVIAGLFMNISATGIFDIGQKMPMMATSISGSMNAAFLPALTRHYAAGRYAEMTALYLRAVRYVNLVAGVVMGFLAPFAGILVAAWLGPAPELRDASLILTLFCIPFHLNVVTGPGSAIFRSIERPAKELTYPLLQLALVTALVAISFTVNGVNIYSIAIAVAAAMVISALLYIVYANRELRIAQVAFARYALLPGVLPYLCGIGVWHLLGFQMPDIEANRFTLGAFVGIAGTIYLIVTAATLWLCVCDHSERAIVRDAIQRALQKGRTSQSARGIQP